MDTNPLMKIEKTKKNSVESKKEDKNPKAQEVGHRVFQENLQRVILTVDPFFLDGRIEIVRKNAFNPPQLI